MSEASRSPLKTWAFPLAALALFICLVAMLFVADHLRPGGRDLVKISGVDEVAYYSMCRSLLLDHDMDLANEYDRLRVDKKLGARYFAVVPETGRPRSVFPIGLSLLEIPFLASANALDLLRGGPGDGYSHLCIASFFVGVVFYLCLGLVFTYKVLTMLFEGEHDALWVGVVTLLLWPSTTLLYYTFMALSQTASFMATALFLWAYLCARGRKSPWAWAAAGASAGLMALCRWQDLLFVAFAAVDELWARGRTLEPEEGWGAWAKCRLAATLAALAVFLPQLLAWKSLFGRYVTIPQGVDFFSFPPPHLGQVLFSSFNGWFTWTPVAALGVLGLLMGMRRRPALAAALMAPIVLQWLLISSLRDSWHGHLFGMRMLTSCTPLVGAGLLWLSLGGGRGRRGLVAVLVTLCAAYTFLFAVQYRLDLVPREDRLTSQELLWDKLRFLRTLRRRAARSAAEALLDVDPSGAARAAQQGMRSFGPDRSLLALWAEASKAAGDKASEGEAEDRLRLMLESRLY